MGIDKVVDEYLASERGKAATELLADHLVKLAEKQIEDEWGTRCPDFEPECPVCKAWAEFDEWKNDGQ